MLVLEVGKEGLLGLVRLGKHLALRSLCANCLWIQVELGIIGLRMEGTDFLCQFMLLLSKRDQLKYNLNLFHFSEFGQEPYSIFLKIRFPLSIEWKIQKVI